MESLLAKVEAHIEVNTRQIGATQEFKFRPNIYVNNLQGEIINRENHTICLLKEISDELFTLSQSLVNSLKAECYSERLINEKTE